MPGVRVVAMLCSVWTDEHFHNAVRPSNFEQRLPPSALPLASRSS